MSAAEDAEFSAKVSDAAMSDAIKSAVTRFGRVSYYHLTIETARILGVGPSLAFRRSFWRNVGTLKEGS